MDHMIIYLKISSDNEPVKLHIIVTACMVTFWTISAFDSGEGSKLPYCILNSTKIDMWFFNMPNSTPVYQISSVMFFSSIFIFYKYHHL